MPVRNAFKSLVVPTDFSPGAALALERALHLPLAPRAKISMVHVVPDDIPPKLRKDALAEAERQLEAALAQVRPLAERKGIEPSQFVVDIVEGQPAHEIVKRAHTVEADVICMGRQGKKSWGDFWLGSTAKKVVREGDVPVLLVRLAPVNAYRMALIALDLGKGSASLLNYSKRFVDEAIDLKVLHAATVAYLDYATLPPEDAATFQANATKTAQKSMEGLIEKSGLVRAEGKILGGDARLLILEEAKQNKTELIVVGTHGLSGAKRFILGSVSEWVLTHATCDVLVARV
jgi:nucleotide-binding universal stress UspA family protein